MIVIVAGSLQNGRRNKNAKSCDKFSPCTALRGACVRFFSRSQWCLRLAQLLPQPGPLALPRLLALPGSACARRAASATLCGSRDEGAVGLFSLVLYPCTLQRSLRAVLRLCPPQARAHPCLQALQASASWYAWPVPVPSCVSILPARLPTLGTLAPAKLI